MTPRALAIDSRRRRRFLHHESAATRHNLRVPQRRAAGKV